MSSSSMSSGYRVGEGGSNRRNICQVHWATRVEGSGTKFNEPNSNPTKSTKTITRINLTKPGPITLCSLHPAQTPHTLPHTSVSDILKQPWERR